MSCSGAYSFESPLFTQLAEPDPDLSAHSSGSLPTSSSCFAVWANQYPTHRPTPSWRHTSTSSRGRGTTTSWRCTLRVFVRVTARTVMRGFCGVSAARRGVGVDSCLPCCGAKVQIRLLIVFSDGPERDQGGTDGSPRTSKDAQSRCRCHCARNGPAHPRRSLCGEAIEL